MARGIWNGAISFGLINIPVSLFSAKEEARLSFNLLDRRDHSPIGYKQYNKLTGKNVERKNIVKGYEFEPEQYVILEDEDFIKANPKATKTIDIEDFVSLEDLDIMLFDRPYYLVPNKNGEKGYVLLREVLKEKQRAAIAKFVLRNRQHLVAVFPKEDYLILEVLRFSKEIEEVHEADYLKDADLDRVKISAKERSMAKALVEEMTTKWKPDQYEDTYQRDLLKYIERKIKSGDTAQGVEIDDEIEVTNTNLLDLMPLLKQSLKAKGSSKTATTKTTKKKKSNKKSKRA
jgi:DNA end-binding protein Ku